MHLHLIRQFLQTDYYLLKIINNVITKHIFCSVVVWSLVLTLYISFSRTDDRRGNNDRDFNRRGADNQREVTRGDNNNRDHRFVSISLLNHWPVSNRVCVCLSPYCFVT